MRGIDFHFVRQFEEFAVQAVVHHLGHHLWRIAFAAREIGATDVADKERVSGQEFWWFALSCDEDADAFGRVAGRFDEAQRDAAQSDLFAVFYGSMSKLDARS